MKRITKSFIMSEQTRQIQGWVQGSIEQKFISNVERKIVERLFELIAERLKKIGFSLPISEANIILQHATPSQWIKVFEGKAYLFSYKIECEDSAFDWEEKLFVCAQNVEILTRY